MSPRKPPPRTKHKRKPGYRPRTKNKIPHHLTREEYPATLERLDEINLILFQRLKDTEDESLRALRAEKALLETLINRYASL